MSQVGLMMTPQKRAGGRKRSKLAVLLSILVVLGIVGTGAWLGYVFVFKSAPDYLGEGTGTVTVQVTKGQSIPAIGEMLEDSDVVKSAQAFIDAASDDDRARAIVPGFYRLRHQMSAVSALDVLADPENLVQAKVVIPEGVRAATVAQIAADATGIPLSEFQAVLKSPKSLGLPAWANGNAEGFLFPATYTVGPDSTATSVLKAMVTRFDQAAAELDLVARATAIGQTPYEIVTIASIEEGEGTPQYFGKISRVIYNRLAVGQHLEMDSTQNYGLGETNELLTLDQLRTKTPYNTHLNAGLTPTPIGNPGEAALQAALNPTPGSWLYFLAMPDGQMLFTDNYQQFLKYQEQMRKEMGNG